MGNNILRAKVSIVGTRVLLIHKFGPEALPLEKQEMSGVPGNNPDEWRKTMMLTKDGQLYVDPSYMFSSIRDGAKYTKRGRGTIQSNVAATLQVADDRVLIDRWIPGFPNGSICDPASMEMPPTDDSELVYLDVRGIRNPSTKSRNVRYRLACSKGWRCSFTIEWDRTIVDRNQMQAVLIDAGKLSGIGDGRSIGYGRYMVAAFEIIPNAEETSA